MEPDARNALVQNKVQVEDIYRNRPQQQTVLYRQFRSIPDIFIAAECVAA